MAEMLALVVHLAAVELYLGLTPGESERLRQFLTREGWSEGWRRVMGLEMKVRARRMLRSQKQMLILDHQCEI